MGLGFLSPFLLPKEAEKRKKEPQDPMSRLFFFLWKGKGQARHGSQEPVRAWLAYDSESRGNLGFVILASQKQVLLDQPCDAFEEKMRKGQGR